MRQLAFTEVPDTIALICWLHKEPLLAALSALVDAESDDAASLSHEARQQREAEAMGDLIDIERQEAELVFAHRAKACRANTAATSDRSRCLVCG